MVRPEGVEPPAYRFEACRSIQLSYGRTVAECITGAADMRDDTSPHSRSLVKVCDAVFARCGADAGAFNRCACVRPSPHADSRQSANAEPTLNLNLKAHGHCDAIGDLADARCNRSVAFVTVGGATRPREWVC